MTDDKQPEEFEAIIGANNCWARMIDALHKHNVKTMCQVFFEAIRAHDAKSATKRESVEAKNIKWLANKICTNPDDYCETSISLANITIAYLDAQERGGGEGQEPGVVSIELKGLAQHYADGNRPGTAFHEFAKDVLAYIRKQSQPQPTHGLSDSQVERLIEIAWYYDEYITLGSSFRTRLNKALDGLPKRGETAQVKSNRERNAEEIWAERRLPTLENASKALEEFRNWWKNGGEKAVLAAHDAGNGLDIIAVEGWLARDATEMSPEAPCTAEQFEKLRALAEWVIKNYVPGNAVHTIAAESLDGLPERVVDKFEEFWEAERNGLCDRVRNSENLNTSDDRYKAIADFAYNAGLAEQP